MRIKFLNDKNEIEEMEIIKIARIYSKNCSCYRYRVHYYIFNDIKNHFYINEDKMIEIIK